MIDGARYEKAVAAIDAANAADPTVVTLLGRTGPREQLHAALVVEWVSRLFPTATERLLLAARAHDIRRWEVPRAKYPMTRAGYHEWRRALRVFHAEACAAIMRAAGYGEQEVNDARALILDMSDAPARDAETQALEDADCLVFLQTKFRDYLDTWDDARWVRVLKGTWKKMSAAARRIALTFDYAPAERRLLDLALGDQGVRSGDGAGGACSSGPCASR
ncbi:MAG: DUF4202 domain-containing protein [Planctomycetes bacterium]|nr:DUF4202 domain-containing protein [Planctomycetota bacterium]